MFLLSLFNYRQRMSIKSKLFACIVMLLTSVNSSAHGLKSATAEVNVRPNNLIEIQVQFDFTALLNHSSNNYSLPLLASLDEKKFGLLYSEVIKLFDRYLTVKEKCSKIPLHRRYPTQAQVFALLKRQFIESSMATTASTAPYTYSDRRFYQLASFDFKINSKEDIKNLEIGFPKELGNIYVTYNEPKTLEVHSGDTWSHSLVNKTPTKISQYHH